MVRAVGVDTTALRAGAKSLEGAVMGRRPSATEGHGFGSAVSEGAVGRFEAYWVSGQMAVDDLIETLAGALEQAAASYERRDTEDAQSLTSRGGQFVGF
ncbi:hypothetical protein AXZ95_2102 [Leifsonia sp. 115AMFTsu3.1]|nr:hypothetical protein AXZ95_2102 [Leifsonia sp. 115AMFTsu3.1]